MEILHVPVHDWIAVALGLIGLITAWLNSKNRLPKWAREWLSKLTKDEVEKAIQYASEIEGMTNEQRKQKAVDYLIRVSEKQLGLTVPDSIANLLVEFVYQQWKKRGK
jgi:hypothetical protein